MAEDDVIIIDDDTDDDDYWMEREREMDEMEREREEREMEEGSSDGKPDFRFRTSDDEDLLQYEREQLSKKNLETSIVQFIRHQELGLEKPRTNSLRTFLLAREICARDFAKYHGCKCFNVEPNHSIVNCTGNKLREDLELIEDIEKLKEDEHENILRRKLETLKSLRDDMNGRREDIQICKSKPASKYKLCVLYNGEWKMPWKVLSGPPQPGASTP